MIIKEECESKQGKWDMKFNKLTSEQNDFKFVIKQKDKSLLDLEKECNQLRRRIDTYFQKNVIGKHKINEFTTQSSLEITKHIKSETLQIELENEINRDDIKLWASELASAETEIINCKKDYQKKTINVKNYKVI